MQKFRRKKRFTFVIITADSRRMYSFKISKRLFYTAVLGLVVLFTIPLLGGIRHITDLSHFIRLTHKQSATIQEQNMEISAYENIIQSLQSFAFNRNRDIFQENIGGPVTEPVMNDISEKSLNSRAKNNDIVYRAIQKGLIDEDVIKLEDYMREISALVRSTPIGWPLDDSLEPYISSSYGYRVDPATSTLKFHEGVDLVAPFRSNVRVTADGIVIFAGQKVGYGNCVIVKHRFNYETLYAHLSRIKVKKGQKIKKGTPVGLLGNTGRSTGPHVHYEVRINNMNVNPWKYLMKEF